MENVIHRAPDLAERIAVQLRQEIRTRYQKGQRMETARALCRRFEVSSNTIRAALKILQREGLIELWHGSGTYVTDNPPAPEVGVLMEFDVGDISTSYFYRRVATRVRRELEQHGYLTRLYTGFLSPTEPVPELPARDFLKDVADRRLSGLAVVAGVAHVTCQVELIAQELPIVGPAPTFSPGVYCDLEKMVREGTRRLMDAGCRRLGLLGWAEKRTPAERDLEAEVFQTVIREHGLAARPEWIRTDLHPASPGSGWEEFREIWSATADRPDGLLVCDGEMFADAAMAILGAGVRVPEELMVVTHATKGAGVRYPFPVGRLEYDPDEYAAVLAGLLIKRMRGEPVPEPIVELPFTWMESHPEVAAQSPNNLVKTGTGRAAQLRG